MAHSTVYSEDLRFTQDSIKNTFKKPYAHQRIDDAVDQIGRNQLSPSVFMPLNVVPHKSVLWSLDNRRLWVLRKAGVPTVGITLVPPNHNKRSEEFFSSLNDQLVRRCSDPRYFPRVRGVVRSVGINRGKGISDGVQMLYPPKEVAAGNKITGIPPPLLPHHLKTGTVRIDSPAKVINYDGSSNCYKKESDPIAHSSVCSENLRFAQHSNVGSSGGAPPPPPPNRNTSAAAPHLRDVNITSLTNGAAPPPPPPPPPPNTNTSAAAPHLRDVNITSLTNGAAPPPTVPVLHHNPTPLSNTTFPNYKPSPPPLKNHPSGGKKGSDSLWARLLHAVNCVKEKGLAFFRYFAYRAFDPCNEKFLSLGINSLVIVLAFCFVLRPANNQGKVSVDSKLHSPETITATEGTENRGGFCGNVASDQKSNNGNVASDQKSNNGGIVSNGYIGIVAVKAIVGVEKMVTHVFSRMFCFLRFVVRKCVDLRKGNVVGSAGRVTLDRCSFILSECCSRLHFVTSQLAVSLGRMGTRVLQFCLQMFWGLLRYISYQTFGFADQMVCWSVGKVQDILSFYMKEIKEFLCKVASSPQIAISFGLKKVWELGEGIITFCLNTIKDFLGLQSL